MLQELKHQPKCTAQLKHTRCHPLRPDEKVPAGGGWGPPPSQGQVFYEERTLFGKQKALYPPGHLKIPATGQSKATGCFPVNEIKRRAMCRQERSRATPGSWCTGRAQPRQQHTPPIGAVAQGGEGSRSLQWWEERRRKNQKVIVIARKQKGLTAHPESKPLRPVPTMSTISCALTRPLATEVAAWQLYSAFAASGTARRGLPLLSCSP